MTTALETIKKSLQTNCSTFEIQPTIVVDGDWLDKQSDSDLFKAYYACKDARAARIIIFYELQRRGKKGEPTDPVTGETALQRFFKKYSLNYDTEYMFCYREKKALEAELNPPKPSLPERTELGQLPAGEIVYHKDDTDEELEVIEDNLTTGETKVYDEELKEKIFPRADIIAVLPETPTTTTKPEKKPCHLCGIRKEKIEKLEKEIGRLQQAIRDWQKATGSKTTESFQTKEANQREKQSKKAKKDAKPIQYNPNGKLEKVGDKTKPVDGLYVEFVLSEKPFAVKDENNTHLGALTTCKSQAEAEKYINDIIRERNDAKAKAAKA